MSFVTAHVLDSTAGRPAAGMSVTLSTDDGAVLAEAHTNADGRVPDLGPQTLDAGHYRITFGTGDWFAASDTATFYPVVTVDFVVSQGETHYHVPLLLAPFAYSTYRGS